MIVLVLYPFIRPGTSLISATAEAICRLLLSQGQGRKILIS
jgi:hypothetical protein